MIEVDLQDVRVGYDEMKNHTSKKYDGPDVWCPECGCDHLEFQPHTRGLDVVCTKCVWGTGLKHDHRGEKLLYLPDFCDECGSEKLYNSNEDLYRCVHCP